MMSNELSISAINEVLEAEKDNLEKIAECKKQAEEIVEQGRLKARLIINRADERITSLHAKADLNIERHVEELKQEMASLSQQGDIDESEREKLNLAVSRLADELVGAVK
jgi:vacuolar-type H+-ATPase subunit H